MIHPCAAAWAPFALGVALLGCSTKVSSTGSDVNLTPATLDFGNVWVGASASLSLEAHNGSMSPTAGTFSALTGAGFSLSSQTLEVPGGATGSVRVTFTPSDAGAVQGSVTFSDEAFTQTVLLTANGVTPGECASATPCLSFVFDFATGACTGHPQAEGVACTDACVTSGVCRGGLCAGAALDCDDGNPCTADGCGAAGCLHVDTGASCPSPSDPCQTAACDPHLGCVSTTVVDGVSCGTNDCLTAHVCIGGACVERPAVNGSVCQAATPCMAAGICQAGGCKEGIATVLTPEWQYLSREGSAPSALALDAAGNLYFTEAGSDPTNGALVSLSPSGALRWRLGGFTVGDPPMAPAIDVAFGQVYVTSGFTVAAVSFDGLTRWQVAPGLDDFSVRWHDLTLSSAGPLVVVGDEGDSGTSSVASLNRATGTVGFSVSTSFASQVFGDGQGNFLVSNVGSNHARLELIDANGQPEWSAPISGDVSAAVLALSADTLVIDSLGSVDQLQTLSVANHSTPRPLLSQLSPFTLAVMDATTLWVQGDALVSINLATGTTLLFSTANQSVALTLTARGLLHALIPAPDGGQTLFEVDKAGSGTGCQVSRAVYDLIVVPGHVLGHTAQGVVSYAFPSIAPTSGWVTARGSAQRDGQAH